MACPRSGPRARLGADPAESGGRRSAGLDRGGHGRPLGPPPGSTIRSASAHRLRNVAPQVQGPYPGGSGTGRYGTGAFPATWRRPRSRRRHRGDRPFPRLRRPGRRTGPELGSEASEPAPARLRGVHSLPSGLPACRLPATVPGGSRCPVARAVEALPRDTRGHCECSTVSDFCSVRCVYKSCGCLEPIVGCGWLLLYKCNGMCSCP
ncbi:bacteriocin fulvocin C-related protein [Streptomyces sp. NPDC017991]|uniref:bacteriocin fulvocin C-related protein n=1 Tax=Streptomyces sp. NPDC017991 TaxID=3365026 RepID=UPI00378FEDD4